MHQDNFEGKWKELRGRVKETWGLTDDDLDRIDGHTDRFLGVLQQRCGYKDKAETELSRIATAQGSSGTAAKSKTTSANY